MLRPGDRHFFGFNLWKQARTDGTGFFWSVKNNLLLPCVKRLPGGPRLNRLYPYSDSWLTMK